MSLSITEDGVVAGEVALVLAPGTLRDAQNAAIDAALGPLLDDAARALGVVVASLPHTFARQQPGRGEDGSIRFRVSARAEGDRLIPYWKSQPGGRKKKRP